jgi:2-iminobutanoate/2-iminopropanoate deaminase
LVLPPGNENRRDDFLTKEDALRQKSIEVKGLSHGAAPIPMACRVGPILETTGIMGKNPDTGEMPSNAEAQAHLCFQNLERVLKAAEMDMGDVVKISVVVVDDTYRSASRGCSVARWTPGAIGSHRRLQRLGRVNFPLTFPLELEGSIHK